MNTKRFVIVFLIGFVGLCGFLVYETGLFDQHGELSRGVIALAGQSSLVAGPNSDESQEENAGDEFDLSNFRAATGFHS